jgi:hypothetical protein
MTTWSTTTWTQTNSGNKDFVVSQGYLSRADVTVTLDAAAQTVVTHWDWVNDSRIRFVTAPAVDAVIKIIRTTPHASLAVTFTDGSPITASSLKNVSLQMLYYAEEVEDAATA